jgi:hypothetical protein
LPWRGINPDYSTIQPAASSQAVSLLFPKGQWGSSYSSRLRTAAALVQVQFRSCGICDEQCGTGAGLLRVLQFPLPFIATTAPLYPSCIIRGWYNRPNSDQRVKWMDSNLIPAAELTNQPAQSTHCLHIWRHGRPYHLQEVWPLRSCLTPTPKWAAVFPSEMLVSF